MASHGLLFRRTVAALLSASVAVGAYLWFAYRQPVPASVAGTAADPATFMTAAELADARTYTFFRDLLFWVGHFWEWTVLIWLMTAGIVHSFLRWVAPRVPHPAVRFAAYIAFISGLLFLPALPLRLISYFVSRHFGVSTIAPAGWLRDQLVQLAIDAVLLLAVAAVVFAFIRKGGAWWLRVWALSIPFIIVMMYVRPVVINPLFYKFEPLADSELHRSIATMTAEAGIPTDRIYQANYSEKTNAINAYVDGIGPSLRIVIWDTALTRLEPGEIVLMTAHEIGHYVKRHLEWSAAGAAASALALLWLGYRALRAAVGRWGPALHIRRISDWETLPLLLLVLSVLTFAATPIESAVSRQAESAADRYAYQLTEDAASAVTLYQKLAKSSAGYIYPAPLSYWFRYTHPSLGERIREAMAVERTEGTNR